MCGIAGVFDREDAGRASLGMVRRMCAALVHRGPDSDGYYAFPLERPRVALGARRLSIIDLKTGDQPLFNEDRSIALVFNGEIFNFVELRAELEARGHTFRTGSDGETLVHLYEERGLELFSALRGMYAFALWDARRGRLVLAVDHVGIKPLYVAEHGGWLRFASEAKALFTDPALPRRLDVSALDTYLTFGYMIGPGTLFEGVSRLAPGHALVIEGDSSRLVRTWTLRYPPLQERPRDWRAVVEEARGLFEEAVRLQLRSDVPLGLFLSGGVDSSAVLSAMSRAGGGTVRTFTVGYRTRDGEASPMDETVQARRTAAHFGTRHEEHLITAGDWWKGLGDYVHAHDEPNANPSMIALKSLSRVAAREVKVALNGTGGDELFSGYRAHVATPRLLRMAAALASLAPPGRRAASTEPMWRRLEATYPALRRRRLLGALPRPLSEIRALFVPREEALRRLASFDGLVFSESLRAALYGEALREETARSRHQERAFHALVDAQAAEDPSDLVHALTIATWLPGNGLLALDKVTMAHGLEARVPFFDPPLLAFSARIPPRMRARGNKEILRAAMRPRLPVFASTRPKRPFETPLRRWFDEELADGIQGVLLDPRCLGRGLLKPGALEKLIASHFSRSSDHTEVIFRLLVLELWQRAVFDTEWPVVPEAGPGSAAA